MFWAHSIEDGETIVKASPGLKALCPLCRAEVHSRTGDIKTWHFAHKGFWDCDFFSDHREPETEWHLRWKESVPQHMREIVIRRPLADGSGDVVHRADILNSRGTVIELQHSPIKPEEVAERESFYQNMIWLYDGTERPDNLVLYRSGDRHTFTWLHAPRWARGTTKPLFIDTGGRDGLFHVKYVTQGSGTRQARAQGYGYTMTRKDFINIYMV